KLTTILRDLAGGVAQDAAPVASVRAGSRVALESLSPAVQDAARGGALRINASDEVQVYVLVAEASDANLAALTAAGARIEVQDRRLGRVQAEVPLSRLEAVASLAFVNAVRLPTYARHRIGAVTTEADPILETDAVRQQYSLDGTGVRVGVLSDGIKGVFATGCTTNCLGVDAGPISTSD